MINRNMIFTSNFNDVTIEILVGTDTTGGIYYLPDDMFTGELIIEGSYDDDLPIKLPLASSMKIKINTSSFTQDMSPLGRWIRDNDNGLDIPNIWIIRRNGNVDFVGVQQPAEKDTHKPTEKEYELTLVSVLKIAMELVYLELDTASLDGTTLDRQIFDYVKINSEKINALITNIYGWGRTKVENVLTFLSYLMEKFNFAYKVLTRTTASTNTLSATDMLWTFYKQNRVFDNSDSPSEPINVFGMYLITEIWHSENGNVLLQDLKGGYRKLITDRYKNYWNFINAFLEGLAMKRIITIKSNLDLQVYDRFINQKFSDITVNNEDLLGNANEINESYKLYRISNNRNNTVFVNDKSASSLSLSGGSTAKPTFETTCLLNTIGNTVANHYHNEVINIQGNGDVLAEYLGLNDLSVADNDLIQWNRLYYWDTILDTTQLHKVADYCKIGDLASSGINGNVFANTNLSDFNNSINQLQTGGLSEIANIINTKVLCKRQLWLKCTLPLELANNSRLGYDYVLNLGDVFKPNFFYDDIEFGSHGVLVNIKENLSKNECECLFFIRSDEWAE